MPMTPESNHASPPTPRRFAASSLVWVGVLSAAAAGGVALWLAGERAHEPAPAMVEEQALYQCPMHPSIVQDHPGECPICGMKLVKVEQEAGSQAHPPAHDGAEQGAGPPVGGMAVVEIDPSRQQLIGLKTAEVTRGPVGGAWRTVGRVAIDETRVRHVNLKITGFVERIFVDFIGKKVRRGDPLFSIYSPELLSAQEEYLLALRTRGALNSAGGALQQDGEALVAAARRKLSLWDVPESEIERITATGQPSKTLTFYSPVSGVVTRKDVVEGMKLDAGAMPYEIVDLSAVWVLADVYESELRLVHEGMAATLKLNAFPNREFKGQVVFIDPLLDPKTRTVKVRLTFPNATGELRPEMFGEVVLQGVSREGLRIPLDAVIDSGTERVVFVALGEGKFEPRRVKTGENDGSLVEVVSGLEAGERVVTRANFLVDSESRLRASLSDLTSGAATPASPESARVLGGTPPTEPPSKGSPAPGPAAGAPLDHSGHRP